MQSTAASVDEYLDTLGAERREVVSVVRDVVRANVPTGVVERMQYGMIGWVVPHEVYPPGYHTDPEQPLPFAALASQKRYVSLYLMGLYCGCGSGDEDETPDVRWFRAAWSATGRKLDMGRSCVRFRRLEDVPLEVVAVAVGRIPVATYVERYESARTGGR